jgi:uncharacterized protein YbaR (Trm112 family)
MSISADLLSILACPSADHAPLRLETTADGEQLVCTSCLSRFPISDGIPVLLADEAVPGPRGLGNPAADPAPPAGESPADPAPAGQSPAGEPSGTTG